MSNFNSIMRSPSNVKNFLQITEEDVEVKYYC